MATLGRANECINILRITLDVEKCRLTVVNDSIKAELLQQAEQRLLFLVNSSVQVVEADKCFRAAGCVCCGLSSCFLQCVHARDMAHRGASLDEVRIKGVS
mmetsp:Transcript_10735/g.30049  ORF Transcript_10735/g.30049 Transcript_10735/m.30049 type:complete len:101 (-) Transcript_10735:359-661(-)